MEHETSIKAKLWYPSKSLKKIKCIPRTFCVTYAFLTSKKYFCTSRMIARNMHTCIINNISGAREREGGRGRKGAVTCQIERQIGSRDNCDFCFHSAFAVSSPSSPPPSLLSPFILRNSASGVFHYTRARLGTKLAGVIEFFSHFSLWQKRDSLVVQTAVEN